MRWLTPRAQLRQYLWRCAEVASLLVFVAVLCLLFIATLKYTLPFVIGGFAAVLLLPLVRWVEQFGIARVRAVLLVLVTVGAALFVTSAYVLVQVTREAVLWSESIPVYFRLVQDWVTDRLLSSRSLFGQLPPDVASSVQAAILNSVTTAKSVLTGLTRLVVHVATHMPESLFVVVVAILTTYFILVNRRRMYRRFVRFLPPGWEPKVHVVAHDMLRALGGTIRVQIILMVMSAVLGVLGLFVMRIHYAVILGLMFGLTGMIPILGSAILSVPWAIGALLIGDVSLALKVILLQLFISLVRHLVEPKILANSVGLDTLSTLFGLYVGMKLMGVVGLLFGPIILIGIKSLLRIRLFVDFMPQSAVEAEAGSDRPPSPGTPRTREEGTARGTADTGERRRGWDGRALGGIESNHGRDQHALGEIEPNHGRDQHTLGGNEQERDGNSAGESTR